MRLVFVFVLFVFLVGCGGPLVMIPGGALGGPVAEVPADWSFTDAIDTVQLETNPADPYSVNVWCVVADGSLYVASGNGLTPWAQNILDDARVRLRADGTVYELAGTRVEDADESSRFLAALRVKYAGSSQLPPEDDPDAAAEAILFRLEAR